MATVVRRRIFFVGRKVPALLSAATGLIFLFGLLFVHNVPKEITDEDRAYIAKILEASGYDLADMSGAESFEEQVAAIQAVQDAVLRSTPKEGAIPIGTPREPKDLYYSNQALCYDRSRTIDKALRLLGFDTRYAFMLSTKETGSPVVSLVTRRVRSHAVIEVETAEGWLIVDSVKSWISLNNDGIPVSLSELKNTDNKEIYSWHPSNLQGPYSLVNEDFTFFYGLYSRHGGFYAPYTPLPDINWGEFLQNLRPA